MNYQEILDARHNSHKTAITRHDPSAPLRFLLGENEIEGRVCDYGSGKGRDLAELRGLGFDTVGYDPYHQPCKPDGLFDTILCTYVLNTVTRRDQQVIIGEMAQRLNEKGYIFVTVRRDLDEDGFTKSGTYQMNVTDKQMEDMADEAGLGMDIYKRKSGQYTMYVLTKMPANMVE